MSAAKKTVTDAEIADACWVQLGDGPISHLGLSWPFRRDHDIHPSIVYRVLVNDPRFHLDEQTPFIPKFSRAGQS